jgi:DNA-binding IclR family transcriptional regulator
MPLSLGVTALVLQRICGEYLEMPGLRLTLKQATRFWGMDEQTCARSLDYLVEIGFLARVEQGTYRLSDGAVKFPSLGMAKASLGARWPALLRDAS